MSHNLRKAQDRLRSITGFTGSSGYIVVNSGESEKSLFVTDSRYELQANMQVDSAQFEIKTDARPLLSTLEQLQGSIVLDGRLFSAS